MKAHIRLGFSLNEKEHKTTEIMDIETPDGSKSFSINFEDIFPALDVVSQYITQEKLDVKQKLFIFIDDAIDDLKIQLINNHKKEVLYG